MRIDRILLDILDWLRRRFYWERGAIDQKPFEILESFPCQYGRLLRVLRDTDRAIRTWEFHPYRPKSKPKPWIIRICCDFLEPLPGQKRRRYKRPMTHRLQVLLVSSELNADGTFDFDSLFDGVFDWQRDQRRDYYAILIVDRIAKQLLYQPYKQIDWSFEAESAAKEILGGGYRGLRDRYPDSNSVSGWKLLD